MATIRTKYFSNSKSLNFYLGISYGYVAGYNKKFGEIVFYDYSRLDKNHLSFPLLFFYFKILLKV